MPEKFRFSFITCLLFCPLLPFSNVSDLSLSHPFVVYLWRIKFPCSLCGESATIEGGKPSSVLSFITWTDTLVRLRFPFLYHLQCPPNEQVTLVCESVFTDLYAEEAVPHSIVWWFCCFCFVAQNFWSFQFFLITKELLFM